MPGSLLSLNFHVEDRSGIMVVVFADGIVRPASIAEVELWNVVTKRFQSTRESYVRISEQDLLELLRERDHLRDQVTALQRRGTELVEMNRGLKRQLQEAESRNAVVSPDSSKAPGDP